MSSIKVNINKPDPSPQAIRKHKNYQSFMQTYQDLHTPRGLARMLYRDRMKISLIVVIAALFLLYLFNELGEEDAPQPEKQEQTQ